MVGEGDGPRETVIPSQPKLLARNLGLAVLCVVLSAHVGSPDAWYEGNAGPYKVTVQVQLPGVVPGIAQIFVRVPDDRPERVTVVANKFDATGGTPPPETATPVEGDPGLYRAKLWLMTAGSNSITVALTGSKGSGKAIVPVVNVALRRLELDPKLGIGLSAIGLFLFAGMVTIIGAAVRESTLPPGELPSSGNRTRARLAMTGTGLVLALLLFGGWRWWNSEASAFNRTIFKPLASKADLVARNDEPPQLVFSIADEEWIHRSDSSWLARRDGTSWTPLIEDHGKLMHLFLIRDDMGLFAHLHPATVDSVVFSSALPPLPPGRYRVFADIVFESGYSQTLVTSVVVRQLPVTGMSNTQRSDPDDSWFAGPVAAKGDSTRLSDGSVMTWSGSAPIVAGREAGLRFEVHNADGTPSTLEPYMGMAGHAVVERDDGSVFVHVHPSGTVSMASQMAFAIRQPGDSVKGLLGQRLNAMERSTMSVQAPVAGSVSFPYAFPKPGKYRIWVQVKKNGRILTGAFDVPVNSGVKSAD